MWARLGLVFLAPCLIAADINRAHPPMNSTGLFTTDSTTPLPPRAMAVTGWLDYAANPLVYSYLDGSYSPLVKDQFWLEPVFNVGLLPLLDVAVSLPVLVRQMGVQDPLLGDLSGTGLGDLRLLARVNPMPTRIFGGGLALIAELDVPTGTTSLAAGQGGVTFIPKVVGSLPLPLDITGHASLEAALRSSQMLANVPLQSTLTLRAGVRVPVPVAPWPLTGLAELVATTPFATPFSRNGVTVWEGFLGVRTPFDRGDAGAFDLTVGAAAGLSQGVGVPTARGLVSVTWRSSVTDRDHDGVPDTADACPDEPEDMNGFADLDGCPDAEELKATQNANTPAQAPPAASQTRDRDGDGIPDAQDMCPYVPEDKDGVLDADGCPDADNDHDGVADDQDQCPNTPETINGVTDEDGCPDAGEAETEYVPKVGITLKTTIQFEVGRAVIKHESYSVLDQVALQLLAHDEVLLVRIEGHTDSAGPADKNLLLSHARATAVRQYLVERGVDGGRLEAQGYGETRPIATNDTAAGRAQNRRVEFVILRSRR